MGLFKSGLNSEVVLFLRLLNTENAALVHLLVLPGSCLYSEVVLILRWAQVSFQCTYCRPLILIHMQASLLTKITSTM